MRGSADASPQPSRRQHSPSPRDALQALDRRVALDRRAVGAWRWFGNRLATASNRGHRPSRSRHRRCHRGSRAVRPMRLMSDSVLHFSDNRFAAPQEIVRAETGLGWRSSPPRWPRIAFPKRSRMMPMHGRDGPRRGLSGWGLPTRMREDLLFQCPARADPERSFREKIPGEDPRQRNLTHARAARCRGTRRSRCVDARASRSGHG